MPDADIVVATGWQTSGWVQALPAAKGLPFYFVQNDERRFDPRASETWTHPAHRFTCSEWLSDLLRENGHSTLGWIGNAIDPAEFALEEPVAARGPVVSMLYHRAPFKGAEDGIRALELVKTSIPELQVEVFSARPPSHRLPSWWTVHVRPDTDALRALYNRSAVFLHPSHLEGWPLPPMEASVCGAVVVAAANRGVTEYVDQQVGRVVPVGDAEALARSTLEVLTNTTLRQRLSAAAQARVQSFSWKDNTTALERLFARGLELGEPKA